MSRINKASVRMVQLVIYYGMRKQVGHCDSHHIPLASLSLLWVPVKSVTNHIGDNSIRWQSTRWRQSVTGVSHFGDSHNLSTNNIFRPYISRMQWLKCWDARERRSPPPIYGSKRSPTSDCYIMLGKGTPPLSGAQTW